MSSEEDQKIIDQVENWSREKFENERRSQDLKHARLLAVGKFLKLFSLLCIFGVLGLGITLFYEDCQTDSRRKEKEELQESNHRSQAMSECIQTLGMRKCRLIEQHGLEGCENQGPEAGTCIRKKLEVRWGSMTDLEVENSVQRVK